MTFTIEWHTIFIALSAVAISVIAFFAGVIWMASRFKFPF